MLMSEDRSVLDDNRAIFTIDFFGYRGTRGRLTLIWRKCEIIGPEAANLAKLMPIIGHFIKRISNVFHSFKEKRKEFSEANLLSPNRIISMLTGTLRYLKNYHEIDKKIIRKNDLMMTKNVYLMRASSTSPHYYGNRTH